ncbi:hypothetical protein S40285_05375 [Stachybotrys chlorohalonatus IBT 40285]|uniref:Major facilitator superfamily (MFS) profile domain-containing protein n=1 Tax=Stachybotrys chlorohalonatus (strain IBT 40285) TaxID=1283841 RepID=A0A084QPE5_STAC4|nr:hypothetical protein S40285_05375 [Stachybotrys chlorohalonata IBT 40285]
MSQPKDPNAFPYWQLAVLAICRFSEPIAFNSILAYSYVFVTELHDGNDDDAPFYSGLLVSAYAVAEALTAMGWGTLSDHYGRKPVVLIGLAGVAASCLVLGFAKSFWVALFARFLGGALNGNVSVMQTMVAEMIKLPEHEPVAYAVQPFVWTLGGILGSALGGFLAQPAVFYPEYFSEDGIFGQYPFLLPNLASVFFIVLAIIQGIFFLEETNPLAKRSANQNDSAIDDQEEDDERTPLFEAVRKYAEHRNSSVDRPFFAEESLAIPGGQPFDLRRNSFGTMHSIDIPHDTPPTPLTPRTPLLDPIGYRGPVFNYTIIMITISLILISYHQMAFFALVPVHLVREPKETNQAIDFLGGLGYTVHDVSTYLAINGVVSLFIQAFIFPIFVRTVGIWYSYVWMVILHPTVYLIMPFLGVIPELTSPGVHFALTLQSFFNIIVNPVALILLKDATPSTTMLGRVNGLAMSACCGARTISPPLAGIIYSAGGSAAAWFSCAGFAIIGAIQLFWVPRKHIHAPIIENPFEGAISAHEFHEERRASARRISESTLTEA